MTGRPHFVLLVFALSLALVIVGLTPVVADERVSREAQFTNGLGDARDLMGQGKCQEGLTLVKELLKKHARHPYALARRAEIEDLVLRLAFGVRHPWPKAKDMVSGRITRCAASTGSIKITYTPRTAGDLESISGGGFAFPARMKGSFSVKLKGRPLPKAMNASPRLMVGGEPDPKTGRNQLWVLVAGSPRRSVGRGEQWLPARLIHVDGAKEKVEAERDPSPVKAGSKYELEMKVRSTKITAKVMGRSIGSDKKPKDVFGRVAFRAANWTELIIDGIAEPSWIQGKIDEHVQGKLERFEAAYDPKAHLPAWLLDGSSSNRGPAAKRSGSTGKPWPAGTDPALLSELDEAAALIDRGLAMFAVAKLEALRGKDGAAPACDYLLAQARLRMFQLPEALSAVDACVTATPSFLRARFLKARILIRMGRRDAALAAIRATVEDHPDDPGVYEASVLQLLFAGMADEAIDLNRRAFRKGLRTPRLEALSGVLVKVVNGPTWTRVYDHESKHYHVFSDIDEITCRKAARTLEEGYRVFERAFKRESDDPERRFKVYLFQGQKGFERYFEDLDGLAGSVHVNVAGMYSGLLKQLLIWNLPNREMMLRTVRHEGLHQYLDAFLPYIPPWFNEGLAEYYEYGHRTGAKLCFGRVRHDYVKLLRSRPPVSLRVFLHMPSATFYKGGMPNYAQAWAILHMLQHGGPKREALFRQLLKDLETKPPHVALAGAFGGMDLDKFDADFRAYLDGLAEGGD